MRASLPLASPTHSRGIALIAGLLLMSSMVILGLAVATGMLLERRMASNFGDQQLALERAELAGRWAQYWLQSRSANPLDDTCSEDCGPTPPIFNAGQLPAAPESEPIAWWQLNAVSAGQEPDTGDSRIDYTLPGTDDPLWLIEEIHLQPLEGIIPEPGDPEPTLGYYRVLGRGSGRLPGSVAVTEIVIARPWAASLTPASFPPWSDETWFCEQVPGDVPCGRQAWRRRR